MSDLAAFHEVRFPLAAGFGASGGPQWRTDIVTLGSGAESRNARWAAGRRRYDAGPGIRTLDALNEVAAFFDARRGRLHSFRFRDPLDWKSCAPSVAVQPTDVPLGVGDGETTTFQLAKPLPAGAGETAVAPRAIRKPVEDSVRVSVDGVEQAGVSVDPATGLVTFPSAPAPGAVLAAGFLFDVPVRFDTDRLDINFSHFEAGSLPSVPLVEIRP